ncbi:MULTISPECIES: MarR family transcriptional regulator [unclassified Mycobacterium]|uniref:MarR family transcriptional regulator n=1 Tax=unclassified Mycobacterium TaxID=2642494 RepID=UPI0029C714C4|nr:MULTISPECIES: MarR family transcriptional regulator [unclassified Mycobacterium]
MIELKVLQTVRLKGRIKSDDVAESAQEDAAAVADALAAAAASGFVIEAKTIRLSPEGRARLDQLLDEERAYVNKPAIYAAYDEFRTVNADFKALVSDWQVRDGAPNTHDDDQYDRAVLDRLGDVHARVEPIIATVAGELRRLEPYSAKLRAALNKVNSGDTAWLTRPIIDSYHTVWFELHEELILAAGLTRQEEARAGHAQ